MNEQANEPKKEKEFPIIPAAIVSLILLTALGAMLCTKFAKEQQWEYIRTVLLTKEYQGVFLSTYDISSFTEEDLTEACGLPILKLEYVFESADQLNEAMETAFSSDNQITNVYLGLDPFTLYRSEKEDAAKAAEAFEAGWLACAGAHPEITFEVLLSFPSMEYWMSLEEAQRQTSLLLCQQLTDLLAARSNVTVYYAGGQEWLTHDSANYVSYFGVTEEASQRILQQTFGSGELQITSENAAEMLGQTADQIAAYEAGNAAAE